MESPKSFLFNLNMCLPSNWDSTGINIYMTCMYTLGSRAAGREMGRQLFLSRRFPGCRIWLCSTCHGASWLGKVGMNFYRLLRCMTSFFSAPSMQRLLRTWMSPRIVPTTCAHVCVHMFTAVSGLSVFQSP